MNLYQTLGVNPTDNADVIKAAYRRLAQIYHPDKATGDKEAFQQIQEAHDVLMDPARRARYDATGSAARRDERQELVAELAKMIITAVAQCANPDTVDPIDQVRGQIGLAKQQLQANRRTAERAIERTRTALKRLQFKGQGENLVALMLQSTIKNHEGQLAGMDEAEKRADAMAALLEDYGYTVDPRTPFEWTRSSWETRTA
ncbi:MAG TPA: J domain-containing protein [Noviherbaspirillum sp.]